MFFDRIANSWRLAKSSWHVLVQDKKLLIFPVLSGLACLLVLISFLAPIVGIAIAIGPDRMFDKDNPQQTWWAYPVLFAYYFCNYFVVVFCNSALVSCAMMHFHGERPTLRDGLRAAWARLPQIVLWSLVAATVGVLLRAIESTNRRVGELVAALLGTAWTVMTYFVVPVIVMEKANPFQAIGRSLGILRKTWGEALVGNLGLGLFKFLLALPLLLLILAGVALCAAGGPLIGAGAAVLLLAAVYFLVYLAVVSALGTIYLSALYQYAAFDAVPAGFDADAMRQAFVTRG
jgi:hypothetical protein